MIFDKKYGNFWGEYELSYAKYAGDRQLFANDNDVVIRKSEFDFWIPIEKFQVLLKKPIDDGINYPEGFEYLKEFCYGNFNNGKWQNNVSATIPDNVQKDMKKFLKIETAQICANSFFILLFISIGMILPIILEQPDLLFVVIPCMAAFLSIIMLGRIFIRR